MINLSATYKKEKMPDEIELKNFKKKMKSYPSGGIISCIERIGEIEHGLGEKNEYAKIKYL